MSDAKISPEMRRNLIECVRATARSEILPRYRKLTSDAIEIKTTSSDLVTIADHRSEASLNKAIKKLLPDALIVGEEAVAADASLLEELGCAKLSVIIDPIDGTWNYAKGLPLFGVILAVVAGGSTIFGLLYDPVSDDWIYAHSGAGAAYGAPDGTERQVFVADPQPIEEMAGFLPLFLYPKEQQRRLSTLLPDFERVLSFRCSCHEYRILAEGSLSFGISGLLKPWDHAAGELIFREAGGYAAILEDGSPYSPRSTTGQLLLAPDEASWHKLQNKILTALGRAF